jgi:hypothetical protein
MRLVPFLVRRVGSDRHRCVDDILLLLLLLLLEQQMMMVMVVPTRHPRPYPRIELLL